MQGEPPQSLVKLLEQLGLATAAQVRRVAPRVRRLAGELPDFATIWVDALQQAQVLTPLQAAEINAGRGESLRRDPYIIAQRLAASQVATCFAARHLETGRMLRLYCVERPQPTAIAAAQALDALVNQLAPLTDQWLP